MVLLILGNRLRPCLITEHSLSSHPTIKYFLWHIFIWNLPRGTIRLGSIAWNSINQELLQGLPCNMAQMWSSTGVTTLPGKNPKTSPDQRWLQSPANGPIWQWNTARSSAESDSPNGRPNQPQCRSSKYPQTSDHGQTVVLPTCMVATSCSI